jgi:hypothetical protein
MKCTYRFLLVLSFFVGMQISLFAQAKAPARNLIIFVMDGYRWQELYTGADSAIIFNHQFNHTDSAWTVKKYWDSNMQARRQKLMPFVWGTIAQQGQLYGNRKWGNLVNVENTYWFSYPGRSEIFTGYFDKAINSNDYPNNPNTNVLEFINQQHAFHNKIDIFSSWDAVARIMNRDRNGLHINIYGEDEKGAALTPMQRQANVLQHMLPDIFGKGERLDEATYALAKSYMLANHPRVLYIDLGDNDDFGHAGEYGDYLDAAHYADAMFKDIWDTIQKDPFYKDQTAMLIFPDHGRGLGAEWTNHGSETKHSDETYLMAMGAGIKAKGEIKEKGQLFEAQFAQTISALLGFHFTADHPVAPPVSEIIKK